MNIEYKEDCCSFCDPQTEGKITWLGEDKIKGYTIKEHAMNEEGFYLESGCLYAIASDPYCGTGPLKINFCPVCGRSLRCFYYIIHK